MALNIPGFRKKDYSIKNLTGGVSDAFVKPFNMGSIDAAVNSLMPKPPKAIAPPLVPQLEMLAPRKRKTQGDLKALFTEFAGIKTTPQGLA